MTVFQMLFKIFHLYKKVSKQKGAMLDGSKTAESREVLYNKMAKPPRVDGRGLNNFAKQLQQETCMYVPNSVQLTG